MRVVHSLRTTPSHPTSDYPLKLRGVTMLARAAIRPRGLPGTCGPEVTVGPSRDRGPGPPLLAPPAAHQQVGCDNACPVVAAPQVIARRPPRTEATSRPPPRLGNLNMGDIPARTSSESCGEDVPAGVTQL